MIRSLAALFLPCFALAACDSVAGSSPRAQRFALDVTAPVVLHHVGTQIYILHDTLQVEPDGTAERRVRHRFEFDNPLSRDTTVETREAYTYTVDGTRIQFNNVCPPYQFCGEGRFLWGQVDGNGMRLQILIDSVVPLTYRRLPR
ncbi:MAG TPA: hypothetical protein VK358_15840 [Longimicrobium sp.]|nr:hypothetical protein [Longimicrobium sp.]